VGGETDIMQAAVSQQLEMSVEDVGKITAAGNDRAYMFISDTSELQSLGDGIFCTEALTDAAAPEAVEQPQNGDLLPMLSETGVQQFDNTSGSIDAGRVELDASATNTAEPSPNTSVNTNEKPDNPHPLGSSQNPIRIIQQGNKYTSMQELSQEQLSQIMQVCHFILNCYYFCVVVIVVALVGTHLVQLHLL